MAFSHHKLFPQPVLLLFYNLWGHRRGSAFAIMLRLDGVNLYTFPISRKTNTASQNKSLCLYPPCCGGGCLWNRMKINITCSYSTLYAQNGWFNHICSRALRNRDSTQKISAVSNRYLYYLTSQKLLSKTSICLVAYLMKTAEK